MSKLTDLLRELTDLEDVILEDIITVTSTIEQLGFKIPLVYLPKVRATYRPEPFMQSRGLTRDYDYRREDDMDRLVGRHLLGIHEPPPLEADLLDLGRLREGYNYSFNPRAKEIITSILELSGFKNPELQSVEARFNTRRPVYVVNFTFGDNGSLFRQLFIKKSPDKRDIYLPLLLSSLGVSTVTLVGINPTDPSSYEGYENSYGYLLTLEQENHAVSHFSGYEDYTKLLPSFSPDFVISRIGRPVMEELAKMHILVTKNLGVLKKEYGIELPEPDYGSIFEERLLNYLNCPPELKASAREAVEGFVQYYLTGQYVFVHGDSTTNNFRALTNNIEKPPVVLDFELSRLGFFEEDVEMFINDVLGKRSDGGFIRDETKKAYRAQYVQAFSQIAAENDFQYEFDAKRSYAADALSHLLRIGDQLMVLKKLGNNSDRIRRAAWHTHQFFEMLAPAVVGECSVCPQLRASIYHLFDSSSDMGV